MTRVSLSSKMSHHKNGNSSLMKEKFNLKCIAGRAPSQEIPSGKIWKPTLRWSKLWPQSNPKQLNSDCHWLRVAIECQPSQNQSIQVWERTYIGIKVLGEGGDILSLIILLIITVQGYFPWGCRWGRKASCSPSWTCTGSLWIIVTEYDKRSARRNWVTVAYLKYCERLDWDCNF